MTDQEQFEILSKKLKEAGDKFMEADKKLSIERGFVSSEILSNYLSSKDEWQAASNEYFNFLALKIAENEDRM